MIKNATGNCFWRCDQEDEYRVSFVARLPEGGEEVLMTFRTFEQEKFLSIAVLIGERQHLWAKWRSMGERNDQQAMDKILASLWTTDYLENVVDVRIVNYPSQAKSVIMSVHLLPTRKVKVIKHKFQTSQLHKAFLGWVEKADLGSRFRLCLIGLLEGKEALAVRMNAIAEAELGFGQTVMNAVIQAIENGRDSAFIPGSKLPF